MNNIKFKVGDIVCYKHEYDTPFGATSIPFTNIVPLRVEEVIPDDRAAQRVGELGNSNRYYCIHSGHLDTIMAYQYQLVLWSEMKDWLLNLYKQRIEEWNNL